MNTAFFPRFLGPIIATLCLTMLPVKGDREVGWDDVPTILARIKAPTFPERDFNITDHGAKANGSMDCTEAIARAIKACHDAGGGRVLVAGGTFLTGAVHLRTGVNLHVAAGATLKSFRSSRSFL